MKRLLESLDVEEFFEAEANLHLVAKV